MNKGLAFFSFYSLSFSLSFSFSFSFSFFNDRETSLFSEFIFIVTKLVDSVVRQTVSIPKSKLLLARA